jgi:hypothetical protein
MSKHELDLPTKIILHLQSFVIRRDTDIIVVTIRGTLFDEDLQAKTFGSVRPVGRLYAAPKHPKQWIGAF